MSRALSVYLDLLRFLAALVVVLHHMPRVAGGGYELFERYGEDAVMIFFVLSGFVIAHVAATKERDAAMYMSARFARLYSVALPALALTLVFDAIGRAAQPTLYAGWYQDSYALVRILASLTFTNQLWSLDIRPFGNPPYWSISYEFWYYVFFALLVFTRRRWLLAAWAVLVGPCILLLLPVWLAGVLVYRWSRTFTTRPAIAWTLALAPIAAYAGWCGVGAREALAALTDPVILKLTSDPWFLHKARYFLHDYVLAAMLAVHFLGVVALTRGREWAVGRTAIPKLAAYTLSLYLLHHPLMYMLSALLPWRGWMHDALVLAGIAAIVWAVGSVCEKRKGALRNWLLDLWSRRRAYLALFGRSV